MGIIILKLYFEVFRDQKPFAKSVWEFKWGSNCFKGCYTEEKRNISLTVICQWDHGISFLLAVIQYLQVK